MRYLPVFLVVEFITLALGIWVESPVFCNFGIFNSRGV